MKTRLVSIEQIGEVYKGGKIKVILSGEGFHQEEFDDLLKHLQGEGRCHNVVDLQTEIEQYKVTLTFILKGAIVTEQLEYATVEAYVGYTWCFNRDRARRAQAC